MNACATPDLLPILRSFTRERAADLIQEDMHSAAADKALFAYACIMIAARPTETVKDFRVAPSFDVDGKGDRLLSILAIGRVWAAMLALEKWSDEHLHAHVSEISAELWTALLAADVDFEEIETLISALEQQLHRERSRLPIHVHPTMGRA